MQQLSKKEKKYKFLKSIGLKTLAITRGQR